MSDKPKPRFWRTEKGWGCARPYPPPFPGFKADWWKRTGLRGFGETKPQALADLESWERCADIVADIY